MSNDFQLEPVGTDFWNLWNLKHGRTDSGDAGMIKRVGAVYRAYSRGDMRELQGEYETLEAAAAKLRSIY